MKTIPQADVYSRCGEWVEANERCKCKDIELNQIINQDSEFGLLSVPSDSIDMIVCSPPYKLEDGFNSFKLSNIFAQLYRVLKDNSLFWLNFGHLAENKFRPFEVCKMAIDCGFTLNDTITWEKVQYKPIQGRKRLNNLSEFIFLLYKGKMPELDRLSIGVPYQDKTNVNRYAGGRDLKCRGNIWTIPYETIQRKEQKLHFDRFPLLLPEMCIKVSNLAPKSVVLDCFCGSGTSLVAAKNLGHNYIGFELNPEHIKTAEKRLTNTQFIGNYPNKIILNAHVSTPTLFQEWNVRGEDERVDLEWRGRIYSIKLATNNVSVEVYETDQYGCLGELLEEISLATKKDLF